MPKKKEVGDIIQNAADFEELLNILRYFFAPDFERNLIINLWDGSKIKGEFLLKRDSKVCGDRCHTSESIIKREQLRPFVVNLIKKDSPFILTEGDRSQYFSISKNEVKKNSTKQIAEKIPAPSAAAENPIN